MRLWWLAGCVLAFACPAWAEELPEHAKRQRAVEQYDRQIAHYDQLNMELRQKVSAIMMKYEMRKQEIRTKHMMEMQKELEAVTKEQSAELDKVVPPEYRAAYEELGRRQDGR